MRQKRGYGEENVIGNLEDNTGQKCVIQYRVDKVRNVRYNIQKGKRKAL